MEYIQLLQDPRWQKKRLYVFERDNFTCTKCGDSKSTLHVHHHYYNFDLAPWEYPDSALTTYCDFCHEKTHFYQWLRKIGLPELRKSGFIASDVLEIQSVIVSRLKALTKPEAKTYIANIKTLVYG